MSGQLLVVIGHAGFVAGYDEDLVLDRTGADQRLPMDQPAHWPGGRQEKYADTLERQPTDQLREAHVIADGQPAADPVELKRYHVVTGREIGRFATGREEVGFMVGRHQPAGSVKDIAGIEYLCTDGVGDCAADDVDLIARGDICQRLTGLDTVGICIAEIDYLNADGAGIERLGSLPVADAGMPPILLYKG